MKNERLIFSLLIAVLGLLFYVPFLGGVHLFDWDEINFAEISREMILLDDYLRVHVNFLPFWEKPPFFFWLQALAMKMFGVGEFAARLPNALCGALTLVLLYNFGRQLYNHRFGIIWSGVYFGTILPFLYFKSGIIDPWFNLFIFIGLYFFILFHWKKNEIGQLPLKHKPIFYLFWGGFFVGMGILTKGQVAFLIAALTIMVYWMIQLYHYNKRDFISLCLLLLCSYPLLKIYQNTGNNLWLYLLCGVLAGVILLVVLYYGRYSFFITFPEILIFTFAATIVTLTWYGLETWKNGTWFIVEFNKYQYRLFSTPDAGHRGFLGYHFVVLLVGCFPASIFAIRSFWNIGQDTNTHEKDFRQWMKILFWVVLILFSIVRSKIVHYSSMCYFPLTFLAAVVIFKMINKEIQLNQWMKGGLLAVGGLYVAATIILPFIGMDTDRIKPLFDDPFAVANLDAAVRWTGWESSAGIFLLVVLWLFLRWSKKGKFIRSFSGLFGGVAIFVMLTLIFFIGRIEGYSQRAAVSFFESKMDEDCYIISHGYKTYAHLFYARKPVVENEKSYEKDWLLYGNVDKPVYVITKIHKADEMRTIETLEEIGNKNGFVFFKRK